MTVDTAGLSALRRRALSSAGILVVIALALALRLYGINWDQGFPYTPHPDERAILMKVAEISPPTLGEIGSLFDADESPWNPRWFPYGSFPLYLLKGVQLVYSLVPGEALTDLRLAGRVISRAGRRGHSRDDLRVGWSNLWPARRSTGICAGGPRSDPYPAKPLFRSRHPSRPYGGRCRVFHVTEWPVRESSAIRFLPVSS